ncbi:aminoglycoside phosphotransferase [Bacillus sp. AFS015802]|uniref:phosphotransferase n=1 Tax=Bacillus sp. AFS015802 TaxID=2033486 RepID=UPI000BF5DE4E|nr:phosphotransferase [Bacillus sp. AFS015802]PFA62810.1 aminoglycoside phosphotransferase [Bacillus sp. AFS015802]
MDQLKVLCHKIQLGEWISEPKKMSGGLLHTMYAVETMKGKFAIKALNPSIMKRPDALGNYIRSEEVARLASENVPALPAKTFNGHAMQKIKDQWYLVFDWVEGKSVKTDEITMGHCRIMGSILADIHRINVQGIGLVTEETEVRPSIDWSSYLMKGQAVEAVWMELFEDTIVHLYEWDAGSREAEERLGTDMVVSHRDLDPKNVLWVQGEPILIDWESAGLIQPMHDLVETALYWSGRFDQDRFSAFISGYKGENRNLKADWQAVLALGFSGKLGWLEYNLKRSLWMECTDKQEQQLGTVQVLDTLREIREYAERIPELLKWLQVD